MQVSVETTQGLERRLKVEVPPERVDDEVAKRLRDMRARVRLHGFRPGKVPLKVVEKRYGPQVRSEVLSEVVQSSYGEALEQEGLRPAGTPQIDPHQTEAGEALAYTATLEVLPEIEVQGVDAIEIERPQVAIDEADIDNVLARLQRQHASYDEVERAAQQGDRVTIDFHGRIDGEEFEGNAGEDVPVVIGGGQMPEEFEAQLPGLSAGDETRIDYTFPEQFPDEQIAGRTATFEVKAKKVEAAERPALDDEFAKQLGVEDGVDGLRRRIQESLQHERDKAVRSRVKTQAMDGLLAHNQVELPKVLVDAEIDQLREQTKQRMRPSGQADDEPELPASQFEADARRRVGLGLLVNEIVRANGIKLERDRVQKALQEVASGYEQPQQVVQYYTQNRQLMESLEVQVMEDQVVDWLVEHAKVTDKPMSFDELSGRPPSADA